MSIQEIKKYRTENNILVAASNYPGFNAHLLVGGISPKIGEGLETISFSCCNVDHSEANDSSFSLSFPTGGYVHLVFNSTPIYYAGRSDITADTIKKIRQSIRNLFSANPTTDLNDPVPLLKDLASCVTRYANTVEDSEGTQVAATQNIRSFIEMLASKFDLEAGRLQTTAEEHRQLQIAVNL